MSKKLKVSSKHVNPALWGVLERHLDTTKCWDQLAGKAIKLYCRHVYISRDTRDFLLTQGVTVNNPAWKLVFGTADADMPFGRKYKENGKVDITGRNAAVVDVAMHQVRDVNPNADVHWFPGEGLIIK